VLDTIFGLPVHPLVVHATVVLVPLAAILVAVSALWPRARTRIGWLAAGASVVALVLVPLSTESGEQLERRVVETDLVERHAEMGEQLIGFVLAMVVAAVALAVLTRRPGQLRWLVVVVAVLATLASVGAVVQVVRIGHSGAQAAWSEVGAATPSPSRHDDD
jgi:heme/copper-type cytochrome/quinol oxidase subunit 4